MNTYMLLAALSKYPSILVKSDVYYKEGAVKVYKILWLVIVKA